MGLRDIGETLPPGFRFYPSDEELVCHYLYKKITNEEALKGTLIEIDLHTCEPWQLPEVAKLNTAEWYFFSFRDRKYATGFRTNRATTSGYWKATGKDRVILDPNTRLIVGMRKTLVFYRNRAPNGIKTGWIMHEFRLESPHMPPKEDWVLCRVFHKGKTDENNNINNYQMSHCQHMFDQTTTASASTSSPASPPTSSNHDHHQHHTAHTHPCGCTQQQANSLISSNNPSLLSSLNPNCHINNNDNHNALNNIISPNHVHHNFSFSDLIINSDVKNDDDYGFLWDMELEETNKLGEAHDIPPDPLVPHHDLGDVRFDHDQDDGGIVFL